MADDKREMVLRFKLPITAKQWHEVFERFYPRGQHVLNRTEWRGKEPRSCAVTHISGITSTQGEGDEQRILVDVEVTYRPKGLITYTGNTRYDGWTAMMLNKSRDGTLLDMQGKPLPHGAPPIYLPFESYSDIEFNDLDFGEFVGEYEVKGISRIGYDQFMSQVHRWTTVRGSVQSAFVVPRKQRPMVKLALTELPLGTPTDMGTRIIIVRKDTQNLEQLLMDHLMEVMSGFFEGRYSLKTLTNGQVLFAELSDAMIELKTGKDANRLETSFDIFSTYVSGAMMEELAKRLMSIYPVELEIVEGQHSGFLITRIETDDTK